MIDGYHVCLARLDEKLIAQWKKKSRNSFAVFRNRMVRHGWSIAR